MASEDALGLALAQVTGQPGVLAALVTTRDGLPVAALRATDEPVGDTDAWAAVSSTLGSLADQLSAALERGRLTSAVFRTERRWFLLRALPVGFLVVISEEDPSGPDFEVAADEVARATAALAGAEGKGKT